MTLGSLGKMGVHWGMPLRWKAEDCSLWSSRLSLNLRMKSSTCLCLKGPLALGEGLGGLKGDLFSVEWTLYLCGA